MDSLPPTEVGDTSLLLQPTRSTLATGSFPAPIFGFGSIPPSQVSTSHYNSYLQLLPRHPRSLVPSSESLSVGRWKHVSVKSYAHHNLDEDEDDEEFESREWLPEARRSLNTLLKDANHSYLLELFDTCE
ncbi:hypothetical protein FRC12_024026 [Ceratobasidium sp. 428]|nr:hypothetical protein FRC12_024026 [Ceratobasidium sp. 428]